MEGGRSGGSEGVQGPRGSGTTVGHQARVARLRNCLSVTSRSVLEADPNHTLYNSRRPSKKAPSSVGYHRSLISQVKEGKGFHYNKLRAKVETECRSPAKRRAVQQHKEQEAHVQHLLCMADPRVLSTRKRSCDTPCKQSSLSLRHTPPPQK